MQRTNVPTRLKYSFILMVLLNLLVIQSGSHRTPSPTSIGHVQDTNSSIVSKMGINWEIQAGTAAKTVHGQEIQQVPPLPTASCVQGVDAGSWEIRAGARMNAARGLNLPPYITEPAVHGYGHEKLGNLSGSCVECNTLSEPPAEPYIMSQSAHNARRGWGKPSGNGGQPLNVTRTSVNLPPLVVSLEWLFRMRSWARTGIQHSRDATVAGPQQMNRPRNVTNCCSSQALNTENRREVGSPVNHLFRGQQLHSDHAVTGRWRTPHPCAHYLLLTCQK